MAKAGTSKTSKKAVEDSQYPQADETLQHVFNQDGYQREEEKSNDEARREVDLYECYVHMDVDGDGLLENRIIFTRRQYHHPQRGERLQVSSVYLPCGG